MTSRCTLFPYFHFLGIVFNFSCTGECTILSHDSTSLFTCTSLLKRFLAICILFLHEVLVQVLANFSIKLIAFFSLDLSSSEFILVQTWFYVVSSILWLVFSLSSLCLFHFSFKILFLGKMTVRHSFRSKQVIMNLHVTIIWLQQLSPMAHPFQQISSPTSVPVST